MPYSEEESIPLLSGDEVHRQLGADVLPLKYANFSGVRSRLAVAEHESENTSILSALEPRRNFKYGVPQ